MHRIPQQGSAYNYDILTGYNEYAIDAGAIIGGSESALRHRYRDRRVQPKPSPTGTSVAADRAKLHADHQRYLRAFKAYIEPKGYRVTF